LKFSLDGGKFIRSKAAKSSHTDAILEGIEKSIVVSIGVEIVRASS